MQIGVLVFVIQEFIGQKFLLASMGVCAHLTLGPLRHHWKFCWRMCLAIQWGFPHFFWCPKSEFFGTLEPYANPSWEKVTQCFQK